MVHNLKFFAKTSKFIQKEGQFLFGKHTILVLAAKPMNPGSNSKSILENDKDGKIKNFKELQPYSSHKEWNYTSKCKNHSYKEATKICLHAGCSLTREICNECESLPPHSTHPQMVFEQRKFLVDTELGLKSIQMNSPLSIATEMLERGRQFFQRHFQSMSNMLVEKSPTYFKVLALIEQTEGVKKQSMRTYELERYVREVMSLFTVDNNGNLSPTQPNSCLSEDTALKEDINDIFFMLRELENGVRLIHDEFARALKFTQNGVAKTQGNNIKNYQIDGNNKQSDSDKKNNENPILLPITPKPSKTVVNGNHQAQQINHQNEGFITLGNQFLRGNGSFSIPSNQNFKPYQQDTKQEEQSARNSLNIQNASNLNNFTSDLNSQIMNNSEVFMDPAFLKRPRGRPKGSKCKRQGKFKSKYTEEEKIKILREVENIRSVQVVADKHMIQNSLIRYWARQLKFELDPQTVSSRRPYRTFSREQKKIIIAEAIMKRDIVLVAQEYDVNAQVLKRWILKSAQGGLLPQQEMRQLMNAVPNEDGNEDDEDEEEEEEGDEEDEENYEEYEEDNNEELGEDNKQKNRREDHSIEDNSKVDEEDDEEQEEEEEEEEDDEEEEVEDDEDEGYDKDKKQNNKLQIIKQSSIKMKKEDIDDDSLAHEKIISKDIENNNEIPNEMKQQPRKKIKREEGAFHQNNSHQGNKNNENQLFQGFLSLGLDIKNLDLSIDTKQQSQQLELFQKQLQEQILTLKQSQLEAELKKQTSLNFPSKQLNNQKL